jgi:hypothetical protein
MPIIKNYTETTASFGNVIISGSLIMTGSSSGSFTGSYTGSFTGSFNDYSGSLGWLDDFRSGFFKSGSNISFTGSLYGSLTGSLSGSGTGSFTGSYSGSHSGSGTGSYTGSFTGSHSGSGTGSYTGSFTGSYSGSYSGSHTGSYTGSYIGSYTGSYSGSFTGSLQGSGSYSTTASYVNTLNQIVKITPPSGVDSAIYVSGSNTVGGSSYIDFLKISNTTNPVANPNKSFRLNQEGTIEVIDSGYANVIWSLTNNGIVQIPSAAGKTTQLKATGSAINFGTNGGHLFDDGNFHIHSLNPNANLWLNTSGSGLFVINGQTGTTGGLCVGTGTQSGYVTISGSVDVTYSYAYLANIPMPGPPTGYSSGTNPYSLTANQRIQAAEFDATSDIRLKNIIGKIQLSDAIRLVKEVNPIKFTWKDGVDDGIKTGYSAQQLVKSGFQHIVGGVSKPGLEEMIDDDGFISPKDIQLVVNTDQITAYHSVLIENLLERIEELEKRLLVSNN